MFHQIYIDIFYHVSFKLLFDYAELKQYDDLPKQAISDLIIRLESFWSNCLVILAQFLVYFGPSWVSAASSSGHLDPLSSPLSFFRESKVLLASTIILFEETSC